MCCHGRRASRRMLKGVVVDAMGVLPASSSHTLVTVDVVASPLLQRVTDKGGPFVEERLCLLPGW